MHNKLFHSIIILAAAALLIEGCGHTPMTSTNGKHPDSLIAMPICEEIGALLVAAEAKIDSLKTQLRMNERAVAELSRIRTCFISWFEEQGLELATEYNRPVRITSTPECYGRSIDLSDCSP